ncbi:rRNA maturation RNase YbeY [Candidatus Falkowbacteria bacterium RBG_13_39_14]|uniref:Endoribonuclease YbeY n=1 Tax=Candidatus Falkowbacteria bacterium RBG_13_39_14 TaxID=1797985 RepID=A0A1F5S7W9_9BACT|nr:MAG: rRNA maturation RNase YbeY [Candidatus Falkowbacteria bacterium RBG_13_39_14]
MITTEINNTARYPVNKKIIQRTVDKCAKFLKFKDADLSIAFVADKEIRQMNKIYRGVDKPTDVLSFGGLACYCSPFFPRVSFRPPLFQRGVRGLPACLRRQAQAGDFSTAGTGKRENERTREGADNNQEIRAEAAGSGEGLPACLACASRAGRRAEKSPRLPCVQPTPFVKGGNLPRPAINACSLPPLKKGVVHGYAEIIISYETAKKQAGENKIPISEEIKKLLIHALLHLSGFDHETDKDAREMEKAEKILLDC